MNGQSADFAGAFFVHLGNHMGGSTFSQCLPDRASSAGVRPSSPNSTNPSRRVPAWNQPLQSQKSPVHISDPLNRPPTWAKLSGSGPSSGCVREADRKPALLSGTEFSLRNDEGTDNQDKSLPFCYR